MIEKNKYQRVIDIFKENCPDEFGNIALGSVGLQKLDDYLYFVEYGGYDYSKSIKLKLQPSVPLA